MSAPVPFDYSGQSVRMVEINGEPWFVARDVCAVLGIRNVGNVLAALDEDEKGIRSTDTLGGPQDLVIVNESGLYAILLRSRKPEAKPFRRWVTSEVLPAIRKNGAYVAPSAEVAVAPRPSSSLEVLAEVVGTLIRHERDLARQGEMITSVDLRVGELGDEVRVTKARIDAIEGNHDYYAALGWARLTGFQPTDDRTLGNLGRIAGTVGRRQGIAPGRAPHAHYGEVNTWPLHVWDEAARHFQALP